MSNLSSSTILCSFALTLLCGCPEEDVAPRRYEITVQNISNQPMSPVVATAHDEAVALWEEGQLAAPGIAALAEEGDPLTLVGELYEQTAVTDVGRTADPMPAAGLVVPRFNESEGPDLTDTQSLVLDALPGDVFSIVGGLLGTNDGFWGIDGAAFPESGTKVYFAFGYDAGTEENNELEAFINDDASRLGPEPIPGDEPDLVTDPDNRRNATAPPTGIRRHEGILGVGNIPSSYDFEGVIVRIEVTRVPGPRA